MTGEKAPTNTSPDAKVDAADRPRVATKINTNIRPYEVICTGAFEKGKDNAIVKFIIHHNVGSTTKLR
jgi:hypothetical protein